MNEENKKRRTSILKKRQSTEDETENFTISKLPKRAQFSQKTQVKEFIPCPDRMTIWGNTYETSMAKSEGSSDGSSTSRKISVDFSHSTINTFHKDATSIMESEKENIMVEQQMVSTRVSEEPRISLENISSASNSIEMTIEMNANERRRVNKYTTDNLNITNMQLDTSIAQKQFLNAYTIKPDKVLSPRKMIFLNKQSNLSVVIQDKVYMSPSELDDNVSVSIEDDERIEEAQPKKYSLRSSTSKEVLKIAPAQFKVPEMPKTFKFQPSSFESPPLKPVVIENQKKENDELFEMIVSDTPSKNLCCLGTCTPNKSAHKVIFSSRPKSSSLRKSTDIFKEIGLIDAEEDVSKNNIKPVRRTIFHDESMKLDKNLPVESRPTIFEKVKMDETINMQHEDIDIDQCTNPVSAPNKSVFDLGDDISVSVAKNIPLIKMNPIEFESEKSFNKRSTLSNDTCNATKLIMEFTNIDDTGRSLESTAEIERKVAKLLKNPNATLGNSMFSPASEDITDMVSRGAISAQKSFNFQQVPFPSQQRGYERKTTFQDNNMDLSGIEPTAEDIPKVTVQPSNPMDITSGDHLNQTNPSHLRISNLVQYHISPREYGKMLAAEKKNLSRNEPNAASESDKRKTVFNEYAMDTSGIEVTCNITNNPIDNQIYEDNEEKDINQSSKRVTTYNANNMDVTLSGQMPENRQIPLKNRETVYVQQMDEEDHIISSNNTNNGQSFKRFTTHNENQMDVTLTNQQAEKQVVTVKNRETVYAQQMEQEQPKPSSVSLSAGHSSKRITNYNDNHMDVTLVSQPAENLQVPLKSRETVYAQQIDEEDHTITSNNTKMRNLPKRFTTFNDNQMDVTLTNQQVERQGVALKSRTTIYTEEIEEEQQLPPSVKTNAATNSKRFTTHNQNNMDVTLTHQNAGSNVRMKTRATLYESPIDAEFGAESKQSNLNNKRATTYNVNNMDETAIDHSGDSKEICSKKNRGTIYAHEMDETQMELATWSFPKKSSAMRLDYENVAQNSKNRITTYNENAFDISAVESKAEDAQNLMRRKSNAKELPQKRATTFNVDISGIECTDEISTVFSKKNIQELPGYDSAPKSALNRITIFTNEMDVCEDDKGPIADKIVENIQNMSVESQEGIKLNDQKNLSLFLRPSMLMDSPIVLSSDTETKDSPLHKKRATSYQKSQMDMSRTEAEKARPTTYNLNMDVSVTKEPEMSDNSPDGRRKTFTVKRESLRWHDITDSHLMNMIENESIPHIHDTDSLSVENVQLSQHVSKHEEAIEDFMNLTIRASPLNQSIPVDMNKRASRRQSRALSPIRDYENDLENFIQDLKKKDAPKPRIEIDKYLEEMKIEPIKIPSYPQNQEGYLEARINELLQQSQKRREDRIKLKQAIEDLQFPKIPSKMFLFRNMKESMEEEIKKKIANTYSVAPIFPRSISFDELMKNKFKTDKHLSENWYYSFVYWHHGMFKLCHKKLSNFTLNFECQQYLSEADESTIPILFKKVILYITPAYRKPYAKTRRINLLAREFHRALNGVDNFTSMCESSVELFDFLDYYHMNVMRTVQIVKNFFEIVHKYRAFYRNKDAKHPYESVHTKFFLPDDVVDVDITIDGYLEDTSVKNLSLSGFHYDYTILPHPNIQDIKGLMFIELVLFDTEKFIHNHTNRVKTLDDDD